MKTVIRLLIALAVANAVARGGMTAWDYYQLKDAAQQLVLFGASAPPEQLSRQILDKAVEIGVPVEPGDIEVSREGNRTFASVSYTQPVEFFPRFIYPVELSFTVEALSL